MSHEGARATAVCCVWERGSAACFVHVFGLCAVGLRLKYTDGKILSLGLQLLREAGSNACYRR